MIPINHQQILNRYDTLSENLKAAGFSPFNTKIIYQISREQHLTDDKIPKISELVGYVLFGFIHPEDLAKEIKESLNLNPEIANSIAVEIDRKIFALIRADLEKVYAPVVALAEEGQPPIEEALDLRGKIKAEEPVVSKVEPPKIVPVKEKPEEKKVEELQPSSVPRVEPLEATPPPAEIKPEAEGPMIIHKEAEFKPLAETKKSLGGLFGFLRKGKKEEKKISPVKAQVEIGLGTKPHELEHEITQKEPSEPPKVRVVHYTEFPTPISPFGKTEEEVKKEVPAEAEKPAVAPAFAEASAGKEAMADKKEIKPPENLPIKTEPKVGLIKETKKEEVQPLDLRKPPAAADSTFVATSAKEAAALAAKPEETKPIKPEEEEIIDLSSFK